LAINKNLNIAYHPNMYYIYNNIRNKNLRKSAILVDKIRVVNFHVISEVAGGGEGFGTALALMRLLL